MVLLVVVLLVPVSCGPPVTPAVASDGGLSDNAAQNVQIEPVTNRPPEAVISGPTSGLVGETLSFSGADSKDDSRIVSYVWNFGDGTTGSEISVTHVYTAAGSYQVTLTVTDDGKGTDQVVAQTQVSTTSKTYKVQSGDCLMGIARELLGDPHRWREIANLNGISGDIIYSGQELKIPEK